MPALLRYLEVYFKRKAYACHGIVIYKNLLNENT
jgi:hypothetical protein